jgi:hypothetical protein
VWVVTEVLYELMLLIEAHVTKELHHDEGQEVGWGRESVDRSQDESHTRGRGQEDEEDEEDDRDRSPLLHTINEQQRWAGRRTGTVVMG